MTDNERVIIHNLALADAMQIVLDKMREIVNRPIGQDGPNAVETLGEVNHLIFAKRK
jgi:hypothetical protein